MHIFYISRALTRNDIFVLLMPEKHGFNPPRDERKRVLTPLGKREFKSRPRKEIYRRMVLRRVTNFSVQYLDLHV